MRVCARVLAAALMTGSIAFALSFPAVVGTGHERPRAVVAPPSARVVRTLHLPSNVVFAGHHKERRAHGSNGPARHTPSADLASVHLSSAGSASLAGHENGGAPRPPAPAPTPSQPGSAPVASTPPAPAPAPAPTPAPAPPAAPPTPASAAEPAPAASPPTRELAQVPPPAPSVPPVVTPPTPPTPPVAADDDGQGDDGSAAACGNDGNGHGNGHAWGHEGRGGGNGDGQDEGGNAGHGQGGGHADD
jgi:hypothetical protein